MFYRDYPFYPNDHCGVLVLRNEFINQLNIKWFKYTYEGYIKTFASSDSTQPMLYNGTMKDICIPYPFPSKDFQNGVVKEYERLSNIKANLSKIRKDMQLLHERN